MPAPLKDRSRGNTISAVIQANNRQGRTLLILIFTQGYGVKVCIQNTSAIPDFTEFKFQLLLKTLPNRNLKNPHLLK